MDITIGGHRFYQVEIPLLWGVRAVLQDREQRISVIDLGGKDARLEILGDKPAPGVEYLPSISGFAIIVDGEPIYNYNLEEKLLSSIALEGLPDCQILLNGVIAGTNRFMGNMAVGSGVGLVIDENSTRFGVPLPEKLARLQS